MNKKILLLLSLGLSFLIGTISYSFIGESEVNAAVDTSIVSNQIVKKEYTLKPGKTIEIPLIPVDTNDNITPFGTFFGDQGSLQLNWGKSSGITYNIKLKGGVKIASFSGLLVVQGATSPYQGWSTTRGLKKSSGTIHVAFPGRGGYNASITGTAVGTNGKESMTVPNTLYISNY